MSAVARDIYGNAVAWSATGRRFVARDGKMRAEMIRDQWTSWMCCMPAEGCASCAVPEAHDCEASKQAEPHKGDARRSDNEGKGNG